MWTRNNITVLHGFENTCRYEVCGDSVGTGIGAVLSSAHLSLSLFLSVCLAFCLSLLFLSLSFSLIYIFSFLSNAQSHTYTHTHARARRDVHTHSHDSLTNGSTNERAQRLRATASAVIVATLRETRRRADCLPLEFS